MTFDIDTQHWKVFNNDPNFFCYGSQLTIRNVHYFFTDMCKKVLITTYKKVHKILFLVHIILFLVHICQFSGGQE